MSNLAIKKLVSPVLKAKAYPVELLKALVKTLLIRREETEGRTWRIQASSKL